MVGWAGQRGELLKGGGVLFDSFAVHQGSGQKHCPWCALDRLNLPECAAHLGYVGQDMSQLKIRGLEDFVYDSDEAEISDERMPCSNCLCTRGGIIWPFEITIKRGELLRGGDY